MQNNLIRSVFVYFIFAVCSTHRTRKLPRRLFMNVLSPCVGSLLRSITVTVTGAAVSVLPKSCANRTSDADCLPLVAANNSTINTYGNSKRVVDVGLKREYPWTFIVADVKQPIIGTDFLIHYNLLVDLRSRCLRDMRTGLAIPASLSSIRPLSLNRVDTVQNEYYILNFSVSSRN